MTARILPALSALFLFAHGEARAADTPLRIDADFPGGNIVVGEIGAETVKLKPDLRDTTGWWFYWCFRASGAEGRTLTFQFTEGSPVGVLGPAVSLDEGATWKWLGRQADAKSFVYTFPARAGKVRFSMGMPYTQRELDGFLGGLPKTAALRKEVLCQSRKGRAVERLHVGRIDGGARLRIFVSCRAHACEMMMSYAAEGLIEAALAEDGLGKWFRENVELVIVPFVDKDGVEDGDQGKNRKPRDHNRDYGTDSIYPETRAIREFVPEWSAGKLMLALDLHCPALRGKEHEVIHLVGGDKPEMVKEEEAFSKVLEAVQKGPLVYRVADNLPFGKSWNTNASFKAGINGARWAAGLPGIRLATTFELPYANAGGMEVNAASARAFGHDLAAAMRGYLEK